jgi:DNA repair exonuclease SbcCD ATPase subunit
MAFDIGPIMEGLGALKLALDLFKTAREQLPEGQKKEVEAALDQAERKIALAESQIAQGLEYELCKAHFPPQVMLSKDDKHWKCPECGNEKVTGAGKVQIRSLRR